jgi:lipopolysaccharide transport system ATP-binding protein
MSSDEVVIDVRHLSKRYEIYNTPRDRLKQLVLPHVHGALNRARTALGSSQAHSAPRYFREFWALQDLSFQIKRGETFGIIGRNGAGKSTLLQILAGTLTQTGGEAIVKGRIAALLELGSGFNPEFTGRENVFLNGRILGLTQEELEALYDRIVAFADIGEFIDQPVKTYSSGMFVRLAFAVQAHIDASVVIIDEALAVGDVFFRQKCYARLEQLRSSGAAILLVSHSMPDIEQYCERALLLDQGKPRFIGPSSDAAKHYYVLEQGPSNTPKGRATPQTSSREPIARDDYFEGPAPEALVDLSSRPQIGNGKARCVGAALCDADGQPRGSFRQGDVAVFHYEFELLEDIGVPICGLVIANDRGVIVHGKNAWQFRHDLSVELNHGRRVVCRHEIALNLGPGEYTFELGLAAVTRKEWENRRLISHEEWAARHLTVCVVTNAGQFSVGLANENGVSVLTHHGIADLPGKLLTRIVE